MNMRKFIFLIIGAIALSLFLTLTDWRSVSLSHTSPSLAAESCNEGTSSETGEKLWIDTVMFANGHSFGYSGDVSMWDGWYFDTVPVGDDFMLTCDPVGPSSLRLSLVTRDIVVDFRSKNACSEIINFLNPIAGFKRFKKKYEITIDSVMDEKYGELKSYGSFSFGADYADSSIKNSDKLNRMVCNLACSSGNLKIEVPPLTAWYIGYNPAKQSSKQYLDAPDMLSLSDYLKDKTVEEWKKVDDLPYIGQMAAEIDIRTHIVNPRFATFSVHTYDREGTGHGMYTQSFCSFEIKNGKELDNNDIFKKNSIENVKNLLYEEMAADSHYLAWNKYIKSAEDVRTAIEGWRSPDEALDGTEFEESDKDSEFILPQGALTNTGVVFSFQPYEIDCWAAGAFHFIIPYRKLMPYLTPKAKALLGFAFDFADLPEEHEAGDDCGETVGDGEGAPDAVEAEVGRQNQQHRDHENDLARQRQEDGFRGHAQRLEEVGGYDLKAYHPETYCGYLQAVDSTLNLRFVLHEHLRYLPRKEGSDQRA